MEKVQPSDREILLCIDKVEVKFICLLHLGTQKEYLKEKPARSDKKKREKSIVEKINGVLDVVL